MAISVVELSPLVVLGGTFDPVHHGHLRAALELHEWFQGRAKVCLLPCQQPVHKVATGASAGQRWQMLQLAVEGSHLALDGRELQREEPSYTYLTLQEMRAEYGQQRPLFWVMGEDAFLGLNRWYRWQELLGLANLLVVSRAQTPWQPNSELAEWLARQEWRQLEAQQPPPQPPAAGALWRVTLPPLGISSSEIRARIARHASVQYLLPQAVITFIQQHQLYQSGDS
ncbi:nicotinate-nucleotide adenylyltransferase [Balneatrix alpica]|uniref:Probable nicotinate-nucleotide adenylyltransferase n=1 Tax=Balneatrix alpica TaxID=75684 RepID=A0ABV5ZGA3_9GAMM|nr:nicotinate-nucleotide adenylyltransferase [Balneatrix alpica]